MGSHVEITPWLPDFLYLDWRRSVREFAKKFYHSAQWLHARDAAMVRANGLCELCAQNGVVRPADLVHHKIPLTPKNIDNPDITLDQDNLLCLCRPCHAVIHGWAGNSGGTRMGMAFDADGNLLNVAKRHFVIVIGPPCSGKSEYVAKHIRDGEPYWCMSGMDNDPIDLPRNRFAWIKDNMNGEGYAWVEACKFTDQFRKQISSLDYELVRMPTTLEQCLANLERSDRQDKEKWTQVIKAYFV